MRQKLSDNVLLAIAGILFILGVSVAVDWSLNFLQVRQAQGQPYSPPLLMTDAFASILVWVCLLTLFWFVLTRLRRNPIISYAMLLVGLLVLLPSIFFAIPGGFLGSLIQFMRPGSFLYIAGAALAGAGVLNLILPN